MLLLPESEAGVVSIIGELVVLSVALYVLYNIIWKRFLRPGASMSRFGLTAKGSSWAVVTGSSDGIGKIFAFELARKGFNIILISRTMSKIKDVADEIENKYKVKTKGLAVDFAASDKSFYQDIAAVIEKAGHIGILVNNVGINYAFPSKFLDAPADKDSAIVDVNINALNNMVRIVLPIMIKQGAGGIINISSFTGRIPSPMLAVYSGSKAYIDNFSNALATEYKSQGISVISIAPGLVTSNMSKIRHQNLLQGVTRPEPVVRSALNNLGLETKWTGHWVHSLQEFVMAALPLNIAMSIVNSKHQTIRNKALAKQSRENAESKTKNH